MQAKAEYEARNPSFRKTDIAGRMGRDLGEVAQQLAPFVSTAIADGASVKIRDLKAPKGAGLSNETFLFFADWESAGQLRSRGLVLRIAPSNFALFMDPRMRDQYDLLVYLHVNGRVRVPEPILFAESTETFGQAFMLMERLEGQVPITFPPYNAAGFVFDATPAERRRMWEDAVDQLARINAVPLEDVQFLARCKGDGSFSQQFAWWRESARWASVEHYPSIASMEQWLLDNEPTDPAPGLSWGDARFGNIMFGNDFRVAGVMDWEQLGLGGALIDLGWWLYFDRFHSEALGLTRLDGLGTREETEALWQERTGIRVRDLDWYIALAGYKVAIITARKMILEQTSEPNNNGNNNIATQLNARVLGAPMPHDLILEC